MSHDQLEMFDQPVMQNYVGEDGHLCVKCDTIKHVSNFEVTPSGEVKRRCNACVNKQSKIINRLKKENPYPNEDYSCPICDRKITILGYRTGKCCTGGYLTIATTQKHFVATCAITVIQDWVHLRIT